MDDTTEEFIDFLLDSKQIKESKLNEESKKYIIDLVGAMLRGVSEKSSKPIIGMIKNTGGNKESTAIGVNKKVPCIDAAFVNGTLAHAVEIDDVHLPSSLHPGAVVIPAALAAAEREGQDGEKLIRGVILGYEAMGRLGVAIDPAAHYEHGFHPTATCGVFGATTAAGVLLGLDKDQMLNAYGIAGSMASGLLEFRHAGSWIKRFHAGWASRNGIFAALLARRGFTGPSTVLEGEDGFLSSYSDKGDPRLLLSNRDNRHIIDTAIKNYACCTYIHSAIYGVIKLKKENNVNLKKIKEVKVGVVEPAIRLTYDKPKDLVYNPETSVDAQFSMPYGVSVGLIYNRALPNEFEEEVRNNKQVLELAKKVDVYHDEQLEEIYPKYFPANIEISLSNGKRYSTTIKAPPGHPENPMSMRELQTKFHGLTNRMLSKEDSEELFSRLQDIDQIKDVSDITSLLLEKLK